MAKQLNKSGKGGNSITGAGKKRANTHPSKKTDAGKLKIAAHARITPARVTSSQPNEKLDRKPYTNGDIPQSKEELVQLIRTIVREELDQLPAGHAKTDIDRLAEDIFNKYDDVFKALA